MGLPAVIDGPPDKIIDEMVEGGAWCVGTPDDLIAHIKRLDEQSGGFGGLLVQATEWGAREQVLHSYELMARYVKPHFQGSLANLQASAAWSAAKKASSWPCVPRLSRRPSGNTSRAAAASHPEPLWPSAQDTVHQEACHTAHQATRRRPHQ